MIILALLSLCMIHPPSSLSRTLLSLWPSGPPDGWKRNDEEISERNLKENFLVVSKVSKPTLEIYTAGHPLRDAPTVIICPGGGYNIEAIEHEGWEIAERLNQSGINAAVLKYRLPNRETDHPLARAPLQDAQRAIRLIRSHAAEFGFDSHKVGILGFSAGGHVAALASNQTTATYPSIDSTDDLRIRPDFTVLIYPAYLDTNGTTAIATDIQVSTSSPPAFIVQTMDDPIRVENAFAYALACKASHVPTEVHIWAKGGHGYGLRTKEPGLSTWPDLLVTWLAQR